LLNLCKTLAAAILLKSGTHFGARLVAFFYWTRCFENNVPFDNTAQIYLINVHWKLGLGFKDGVERYFFLLELERRLLKIKNSGIINNGW